MARPFIGPRVAVARTMTIGETCSFRALVGEVVVSGSMSCGKI